MEEKLRDRETLNWVTVLSSTKKLVALYSDSTSCNPEDWDTLLLGFIERRGDGSWDVFAPLWVGTEPNASYAKKRLVEELRFLRQLKKFNF